MTGHRYLSTPLIALLLLAAAMSAARAAPADNVYYKLGGASPVGASAGLGHQPGNLALGIGWNDGAACSGLDPQLTVANQLNGVTQGFTDLMGTIVQNAEAAVAALPALIIQRAAPGLYDLLSNGVLQGRVDYNKAKLSCRTIASKTANAIVAAGWRQQAVSENWQAQAQDNPDAVAAQDTVDTQGGDNGVTWVGGQKSGGAGQPPIQVVRDTAVAGYNLLQGRANPASQAAVGGGGAGWGSVATDDGTWIGGGGAGAATGAGACQGGMCTVWGSPADAADWITKVAGEHTIQTCSGCNKIASQAGTGLMQAYEDQEKTISKNLIALVNGSHKPTKAALRQVSAGPGMAVSRGVIEALASDPQGALLTHRLAGEMALGRTLTQAIWARRVLLAGASAPGIADNDQGQTAIDDKLKRLDRGIDALRTEMQVRKSLADNAAKFATLRQRARAAANSPSEIQQPAAHLNSRSRIGDPAQP